jgi:hypothetical protein
MVAINRDFVVKNGIIIEGDSAVTSSTNQIDALQVAGGAAIAKNLIVGSSATIFGNTNLVNNLTVGGQTTISGALLPSRSGLSLGSLSSPFGELYLRGNSLYVENVVLSVTGTSATLSSSSGSVKLNVGSILVSDTTNSTSTNSGALVVTGGIGATRNIYVGGTSTVIGDSTVNGVTNLLSTLNVTGRAFFNNTEAATLAGAGSVQVVGGIKTGNIVVSSTSSNTGTLETNALYVDGGVGIKNGLTVSGTSVFKNDVYFQGATTYVYSTNTVYTDNILDIHVPATGINGTWIADDGKNIGFRFNYFSGADKNALLFLSTDSKKLEFVSDSTEVNGVLYDLVYGDFKTGRLELVNSSTSALSVSGGVQIARDLAVGGAFSATSISFNSTVNSYGLVFQDPVGKLVSQSAVFYSTSTQQLVGTITRADNLTGGVHGAIPIQSSNGNTTFIDPGIATGQILRWDNSINNAVWGSASDTSVSYASTTTNIDGGQAGNLIYQSARGITAALANGIDGSILTYSTSTTSPRWATPSTLTVGFATSATTAASASFATTASFATSATTAALAAFATTASLATTATFALRSNTATLALLANTATLALNANTADYALLANTATRALLADTATYALLANTATLALTANTASYALLAGTATFALTANTATLALLANTATLALLANTATYALSSGVSDRALLADTATYALLANTATLALNANTASYALLANTATLALNANTASYALLANTATLALTANTATLALTANTATLALLANTATFALLANTATFAFNASTATFATSSTYAFTATYAEIGGQSAYALLANTATLALLANTATLALLANTATYAINATSSTFATSSTYAFTATYAEIGGSSAFASTASWATTASNIAGGASGGIAYQSNTGSTTFLAISVPSYVLTSNGTAPEWTSLSNLSSNYTAFADNIKSGTNGQIVYQASSSTTRFAGPGNAGDILVSSGTNGPVYIGTASIYIGRAVLADTATIALLANTATLALNATTATYATNLLGGSAGSLLYQSGANATSLLAGGSNNNILTYINNAPVWSSTSTLSGGTASSSTVTSQTLKINNGGLGVTGNSYFANNLGVGGDLFIGSSGYIAGAQIVTTASFNQYASQTSISAGTDTAASTSTGAITIWNTSTLQSITNRSATTTNTISVGSLGVNTSTDNTFAQVTIVGNSTATLGMYNTTVDVGAQIYLGDRNFNSSTKWNSAPGIGATYDSSYGGLAGALGLYTYGGADNSRTLRVTVDAQQGGVQVHSIANSYSTTTGALKIGGGVGIGGNLNVGNSATILSTLASTATIQDNALYVAGGVGIASSLFVTGPAVFQNNVIFSGTATYILSTNTVYTDNITELHYSPEWFGNDGKDIGFRFHYYDTADRNSFLGRDNATGYLEWLSHAGPDNDINITGTNGTFRLGSIVLTDTTATVSATTGALKVAGGVGIAGNVYVGGTLTATSVTVSSINGTALTINASGTASTSATNGVLVVSGGVGISGSVYAGNIYSNGAQVLTSAAGGGFVSTLTAGTDTAVSTSSGAVIVWNTSTLQTVTGRGATTNNAISITNATASTGTSTGALKISGGVGVAESVYVGNRVGFTNASNVSAVYQYYNTATNSLDTVFG